VPNPSQPSDTLRTRVETVSRPLLVRLTSVPRLVVPLVTVALVAVGMLAPLPVALVALALVVLFVAWIAYLAWPVVSTGGKILRLVMVALVVGLGALRF
jgi:uncharacterized protein DUF6703